MRQDRRPGPSNFKIRLETREQAKSRLPKQSSATQWDNCRAKTTTLIFQKRCFLYLCADPCVNITIFLMHPGPPRPEVKSRIPEDRIKNPSEADISKAFDDYEKELQEQTSLRPAIIHGENVHMGDVGETHADILRENGEALLLRPTSS